MLNVHTPARVALGRVGSSLSTRRIQELELAHGMARDAVHLALDKQALKQSLQDLGLDVIEVQSQVQDRAEYLMRPDKGRMLNPECRRQLTELKASSVPLLLVIGDGLSSMAIANHAVPLVKAIQSDCPWPLPYLVLAGQARVALADEIAQLLGAQMVAVLIGERPGLSSPDSLGIYFTYQPKTGCTDDARNCISNIRPQGLSYQRAAQKLLWLAAEAMRIGGSGIVLKDQSDQRLHQIDPQVR
ncbi:ethanolamine ammonia-lyase subunit EutC [Bowmanella dokdonensis]|nr:ethanolamine ammonia-lyase subunit EutC [Bowmanella dokdonensis]